MSLKKNLRLLCSVSLETIKRNYLYLVFFICIFCVACSYLSTRIYYRTAEIAVPANCSRLYYDLGQGFTEFHSVPASNGRALLSPWQINLGAVRLLGIKAQGVLTSGGGNFRSGDDSFIAIPFNTSDAKWPLKKRGLVLFWAIILASGVCFTVKRVSCSSSAEFLSNKYITLFWVLVSCYGAVAFIAYPIYGPDTIAALWASVGCAPTMFSALYAFMANSAYLLFGNALVGLLCFQVGITAFLMVILYAAVARVVGGKWGLLIVLPAAISPLIFRYVCFAEQREVIASVTMLALALVAYGLLVQKRFLSRVLIGSVLCALAAIYLRFDSVGYLAGVTVLLLFPWKGGRKIFSNLALIVTISFLAVFLAGLGETIWNPDVELNLNNRRNIFIPQNMGLLLQENLLTPEEGLSLEPFLDIDHYAANWNPRAADSVQVCIPQKENWKDALDAMWRFAARVLSENPRHYIAHRLSFLKESWRTMQRRPNYVDSHEELRRILTGETNYRPEAYEIMGLQLISPEPNMLRSALLSYANNKKAARLFLLIDCLAVTALLANLYNKTTLLSRHFWRNCTVAFSAFCLGPLVKFASIFFLAYFMAMPDFTDVVFFLLVLSPVFALLSVGIAKRYAREETFPKTRRFTLHDGGRRPLLTVLTAPVENSFSGIFSKTAVGGHYAVTRSVLRGLDQLGVHYNYNPPLERFIGRTVLSLAGAETLSYCIAMKRKGVIATLAAGPNTCVFPSRELLPDCLGSELNLWLNHGDWACRFLEDDSPALRGRVVSWAAGIDESYWCPNRNKKKEIDILLYSKSPDAPAFEVTNLLDALQLRHENIRYGDYAPSEYRSALARSRFMIALSRSESQGLALAEAWAMEVPTFVWNPGYMSYRTHVFDNVNSAPYLSKATGEYWRSISEIELLLLKWGESTYTPRRWVMENMTDKVCALRLLQILGIQ